MFKYPVSSYYQCCCNCQSFCKGLADSYTVDFGLTSADYTVFQLQWSDFGTGPPFPMQLAWTILSCPVAGSFVLDREATDSCSWIYHFPFPTATTTDTFGTARPGGVFDPPGPPALSASCGYIGSGEQGTETFSLVGFIELRLICANSKTGFWQLTVSVGASGLGGGSPSILAVILSSDTFDMADIPAPSFTSSNASQPTCQTCWPTPSGTTVT